MVSELIIILSDLHFIFFLKTCFTLLHFINRDAYSVIQIPRGID